MRKLWWASLIVLLLGNAVDAVASYAAVRTYGLSWEGNLGVAKLMEHLGTGFVTFVGIKVLLGSAFAALAWYLPMYYETPWVGIRLSTLIGLLYGGFFAVAGSGVISVLVERVGLLLVPEETFSAWAKTSVGPMTVHGVSVALLMIIFLVAWRVLVARERRSWQRSGLM